MTGTVEEASRLLKNTGIIALGGVATKLVQFLLLPLYTSVLSAAEYGTVDYINTIVLFLVPAVSVLMEESLFRFLIDAATEEGRRETITCAWAVMVTGCTAFALVSAAIAFLVHSDNIAWVAALVVAQALLQMTSAQLRGFGDMRSYALMSFFASILTIAFNILFLLALRMGVSGMLSATALAQGGVALAFLCKARVWKYLDLSMLSWSRVGSLVRYSVPLIPNTVSLTIINVADRLVIMNSLGSASAGIYALSYKFAHVMDQLYGFFYQSWRESSARALNDESDETLFFNTVHRTLRRFLLSGVLVMSSLMPIVYSMFVGEGYDEGMLYVPVLLLATYFCDISGFYGGIFTAHRETAFLGKSMAASAALCLVLCALLIPRLGLWGASLATLASMFFVCELRRARVSHLTRLDGDMRGSVAALISVAGVFSFYYIFCLSGQLGCLALCMGSALAYAVSANRAVIGKVLALALGWVCKTKRE